MYVLCFVFVALEERLNISKREMAATKYDQDRMIKELDHIKYELNNITSGKLPSIFICELFLNSFVNY